MNLVLGVDGMNCRIEYKNIDQENTQNRGSRRILLKINLLLWVDDMNAKVKCSHIVQGNEQGNTQNWHNITSQAHLPAQSACVYL